MVLKWKEFIEFLSGYGKVFSSVKEINAKLKNNKLNDENINLENASEKNLKVNDERNIYKDIKKDEISFLGDLKNKFREENIDIDLEKILPVSILNSKVNGKEFVLSKNGVPVLVSFENNKYINNILQNQEAPRPGCVVLSHLRPY